MGCRRTANCGGLAAAIWHRGCRAADVKQRMLPQRSTGGLAVLHPACNLQRMLPALQVVQMLEEATLQVRCTGQGAMAQDAVEPQLMSTKRSGLN